MTLVWLSPGLPADRVELADALPPDLTLVAPGHDHVGAGVDGLPVGSLCVATVFEPELLDRLAHRPAGVGLLVVGPAGRPLPHWGAGGRLIDATATTGSVAELVTAMRRATGSLPPQTAVVPPETPDSPVTGAPGRSRPAWLRGRLAGVAAMLVGLAVGGVVIAATEGSASPAAGPGAGGTQFGGAPGGGTQFGGPGGGLGGGPGGTNGAGLRSELQTCLKQQGITVDLSQLRRQAGDAKVRAAIETCLQQLGGPAGANGQATGRS